MDDRSANRKQEGPQTIADFLFYLPSQRLRDELEQFRIEWEELNGPTDLAIRYTSQLPDSEQALLYRIAPDRFFDGLPPVVQDFVRGKMEMSREQGTLDNSDSILLSLYLSGKMRGRSSNDR